MQRVLVRKVPPAAPWDASRLRVGDVVRVRSFEEILATLDAKGCLDGMPFMPEMLAFCGRQMRVAARAHKTCDTIGYSGLRMLDRTVHLRDARCDGAAHGGCGAGCLLYWNEAWLEHGQGRPAPLPARGCSMDELAAATRRGHDPVRGPRFACQITEVLNASRPLSSHDLRQYVHDYASGNNTLGTMVRGCIYRVGVFTIRRAGRLGHWLGVGDALANAALALYDAFQRLIPGGLPFPRRRGAIPIGQPTPQASLEGMSPGSLVRVKPYAQILATLNTDNKTRGLVFDAEHVPWCGREFRVRSLVHRIIEEKSGYMLHFATPSVILDGVVCQGGLSDKRMFCPRAVHAFWRAAWLEPVAAPQPGAVTAPGACAGPCPGPRPESRAPGPPASA